MCGRCGGPTDRVAGETARRYPRCGVSSTPRISPAVIVLNPRGDTALLERNARFPGRRMYSTLAGFVEAGETLEETVAREIREEAGIEVKDVCYFGSQPWPLPGLADGRVHRVRRRRSTRPIPARSPS